jgi:hypothetical protein
MRNGYLLALLLTATLAVITSAVLAGVTVTDAVDPNHVLRGQNRLLSPPICSPMMEAVGSRIHDALIGHRQITCTAGMLQLCPRKPL